MIIYYLSTDLNSGITRKFTSTITSYGMLNTIKKLDFYSI